jgi:hypothetical protein
MHDSQGFPLTLLQRPADKLRALSAQALPCKVRDEATFCFIALIV